MATLIIIFITAIVIIVIFKEVKRAEKIIKTTKNKDAEYIKAKRNYNQDNYKGKMEANIRKGKDYEAFVGSYYETLGYDVKAFGFERGRSDGGIDIVATKNNEALFIQCKNWSKNTQYKINHEKIKVFIGSVAIFKVKYPEYKNIKETLLYVTSEDIFDESAKAYCQENKEYIRYKILPIDKIQRYTTAKLAMLYDITTKEMERSLIKNGYLEQKEKGIYLTSKGKQVGEWRQGEGKGYFLWNANIEIG
jgi:restriction system protein